jgi:hypothetical protein
MQTSHFSLKKIIGLLLFVGAVISILNITSCNDNKKAASSSCLTLTKAQLDNWFPHFFQSGRPGGQPDLCIKILRRL